MSFSITYTGSTFLHGLLRWIGLNRRTGVGGIADRVFFLGIVANDAVESQ
jgi:hypothetical protein